MLHRHLLAAGLLAFGLSAQAANVNVAADGSWNAFNVDDTIAPVGNPLGWIDLGDFSELSFSFTVDAGFVGTLTVVDAVYSGDVFSVIANGVALANTSAAAASDGTDVGYEYDAALANASFSRGVYSFGAGSYVVTGALFSTTALFDGLPLNATQGALKLELAPTAPIPEPATALTLLAGLGLLGATLRRRAQ